ncbi:uncharacterized protein LOC132184587 isoform X2 [Corylus avellana]|uniref:uncharacterized protein LOC132184587 isoform X2 n=1 Tax=Corylus avellana TaxID=13451 RepID=UPI00286A2160|nr:uncharacterized protein LOC132184587 isoform X2 [Corylus avellana]
MESDDELQLFSPTEEPSPAVPETKLKRLKKAVRVSSGPTLNPSPPPPEDFSKSEALDFDESNGRDSPELNEESPPRQVSEGFDGEDELDSGGFDGLGNEEDGSGAKRALEFDSVADEFDGEGEDGRAEMGEGIGDLRVEEPEKKGRSPAEIDEKREKKMKKMMRIESVNRQDSGGFDGLGGDEDGSGAKRALEFESVTEDLDGEGEDLRAEMGEVIGGLRVEEPEKKRRSPVEIDEKRDKKKKKRNKRVESVNAHETATAKRITQKERRDHLQQLRAESQRLLRETRDVSFKPVPLVQRPISSVLEKIRKRKLELSKKSFAINSMSLVDDDDDDDCFAMVAVVDCNAGGPTGDERGNNGIAKMASEEAIEIPDNKKSNSDDSCKDESNHIKDHSSCESIPSQMDVDEKSRQAFRIPIDDTQELLPDSPTSDSTDELPSETPNSPLEEVLAPSILAMNLKLDSAPLDDVSSDEEDNSKENIDPHPHGLSESPDGDPVKAFVDDEAEEEDDSDNDMHRFQDNEEEDENEDFEELKDMIATEYEEKTIDNEKRNELHQKWLEQQDAVGTENLLQKLKCGSKLNDTTLLEDEEDEEGEEEGEDFGDEAAEDLIPTNVARMNLRKVKQMIPQMFTDKDDVYLSSDDEETEKRLSKQCMVEKSEEQATLLSPAEDESSREVFGLIKKLNIVPDTKKGKTPSVFDMPFTGGKRNTLSKSSFLGWGSTHSLPSSKRHASSTGRSFIFARDDSNSRSAISISEDSSDTIQRENRPTRPASAKFSNSQIKASTQSTQSVAAMKSGTSLFEILRQSSLQSKHRTGDNVVLETESVFAAFKLAKKPMKTEGRA